MGYHIFQNNFENIYEFLSNKMFTHYYEKMIENEFRKIENVLNTFSYLVVLFNSSEFVGMSEKRRKATNSIISFINLDIKKFFLYYKRRWNSKIDWKIPTQ